MYFLSVFGELLKRKKFPREAALQPPYLWRNYTVFLFNFAHPFQNPGLLHDSRHHLRREV